MSRADATAEVELLLRELLRFRAALSLQHVLEKMCAAQLPVAASDAKGLFPAAVFEGQQHAATNARAAQADGEASPSTRTWVHPIIDVRRRALVCKDGADGDLNTRRRYRLTGVQYVKGDILGVVEKFGECEGTASKGNASETLETEQHISLKSLRLVTPESFYEDPLLPALEAIEPHHASKNLLDLWLSKLCGTADKMASSFNQKRKRAWQLTDEATYLFYVARKRLAEQLAHLHTALESTEAEAPCVYTVALHTQDARLTEDLSLTPPSAALDTSTSSFSYHTAVVVEVQWSSATALSDVREWIMPAALSTGDAVAEGDGGSEVRWLSPDSARTQLVIPLHADAVRRLYHRFAQRRTSLPARTRCDSASFLNALARLLLRYHALCGGQLEKESGWQAAVPARVMDVFEHFIMKKEKVAVAASADDVTFSSSPSTSVSPPLSCGGCARTVTVECFASPFNATRPFFFSVFADTDAAFGSLGNFFHCRSALRCVELIDASEVGGGADDASTTQVPSTLLRLECNPPFDHEVIAAAFDQLLRWLQMPTPQVRVSLLIIIPDSKQAHATEVRRGIVESPLCRWTKSIPAPECLYVHGAQQQQQQEICTDTTSMRPAAVEVSNGGGCGRKRLRDLDSLECASRLIKLSCPTRVLVVQDDGAEALCAGARIGEEVAREWRALSSFDG